MADQEENCADFYGISTPYPLEWPAEKNNNDDSDDETTKKKLNRRSLDTKPSNE